MGYFAVLLLLFHWEKLWGEQATAEIRSAPSPQEAVLQAV